MAQLGGDTGDWALMTAIELPGGASVPELRAHLAVPSVGTGPWPGVIVLHELLGLTDDIRQQADRLAAAGYLTVAPDLFTAGGARRCLVRTFRALSSGQGPAVGDITAVRRWLRSRSDCTGRVGVVGFCMGGGFALLMAARGFDAAAPNYGPLPTNPEEALAGACPVVGSYGRRDRGFPGAAARLASTLDRLGVDYDIKEYADAGHSFMNRHDVGPFDVALRVAGLDYRHDSAADAWDRILRFFDRHLRDGP